MPQDQFYIKRLVAMGGEKVQIGDDRHLLINGKRLDASTPHFEKVYGFDPKAPPRDSHYSGHVNEKVVRKYFPNFMGELARCFPDSSATYDSRPGALHGDGRQHHEQLRFAVLGRFPGQERHRQVFLRLLANHRPFRNWISSLNAS